MFVLLFCISSIFQKVQACLHIQDALMEHGDYYIGIHIQYMSRLPFIVELVYLRETKMVSGIDYYVYKTIKLGIYIYLYHNA